MSTAGGDSGTATSRAGDGARPKPTQPSLRRGAGKKLDAPIFEKRNWLLCSHYVRKDFDQCRSLIEKMKEETNGICEYAFYVEGLILRSEGKIMQSLDAFREALRLNPVSVDVSKQIGRNFFLLGRHRAALDKYAEAQRLSPHDWEIYHNQGICHIHLGDLDKAMGCLLNAIQENNPLASYLQVGRCQVMKKQIKSAIETYEKARTLFPENSDLLTTLGLLLLETGDQSRAFEMLGSALAFNPEHAKALMAVSCIMQQCGDHDPALHKYTVASNLLPESPHMWNNIGMCYFSKSKWAAAVACLKRATYLAPLEWKIAYNLGLVHLTLQQDTSAFHYLKAAVHLQPNNAGAYMLMAISLSRLREDDSARKCYEKAIQIGSNNPLLYYNYAAFLHRIDRRAEAAEQMKALFKVYQQTGPQQAQLEDKTRQAINALASTLGVESLLTMPQVRVDRKQKKAGSEEGDPARRKSGLQV